jgi:hypothetical protein
MDSRSGDRPHWLFSSSLLFSRSALDEGVRAPELVLLSTRASRSWSVGVPFHLRTRAPERVGRGLKRSATVVECGAGVKPGGVGRAAHPMRRRCRYWRSGAIGTRPRRIRPDALAPCQGRSRNLARRCAGSQTRGPGLFGALRRCEARRQPSGAAFRASIRPEPTGACARIAGVASSHPSRTVTRWGAPLDGFSRARGGRRRRRHAGPARSRRRWSSRCASATRDHDVHAWDHHRRVARGRWRRSMRQRSERPRRGRPEAPAQTATTRWRVFLPLRSRT